MIAQIYQTLTNPWILFGFFAQFVFFVRFVVQWIASEKAGRSIVPKLFWHISIAGTILIIIYSYHEKDVVFFVANVLSLLIYGRNLSLDRTHQRKSAKPDEAAAV